jgi:hypothetical protein
LNCVLTILCDESDRFGGQNHTHQLRYTAVHQQLFISLFIKSIITEKLQFTFQKASCIAY